MQSWNARKSIKVKPMKSVNNNNDFTILDCINVLWAGIQIHIFASPPKNVQHSLSNTHLFFFLVLYTKSSTNPSKIYHLLEVLASSHTCMYAINKTRSQDCIPVDQLCCILVPSWTTLLLNVNRNNKERKTCDNEGRILLRNRDTAGLILGQRKGEGIK